MSVVPREDWPARAEGWRDAAILTLVLAGAFAMPLVFQRDPFDMFRMPKALLLRAEAILIVVVMLGGWIAGVPLPRVRWRDPWILLPLAAISVMGLLTVTSTKYALSLSSFASALATLVVFLATVAAARRHGSVLLAVPLVAAFANAVLVMVEESGLWMPFGVQPGIPHHLQCTALIGNPNEVGSYLAAAALAAIAALTSHAAKARVLPNALVAIVIVAGMLAAQTATAVIAFAAALFGMLAMWSWRRAALVALAGAGLLTLLVLFAPPVRARAGLLAHRVNHGAWNEIFSERFTAFSAAASMFAAHPLSGVGPGAFGWHYYDYKIEAERRYPALRGAWNRGVNFGEVHNDHLQALAEGGVLGYATFLSLLGALAWLSFTKPGDAPSGRERFARRLAFSLAVYWLVLSLAQFPLETTVVRSLLVHLSALCVGWRRP